MDLSEHEAFEKALNSGLHFLSFRLRSINEARLFLQGKHFSLPIIDKVVAHLEETGFLDDRKFAQWAASSRARTGYGPLRIRQELQQKGISSNLIQEVLKKDWAEIIKPLIEKLKSKMAAGDPRKQKLKIQQVLLRHGFTFDHINRAFEK